MKASFFQGDSARLQRFPSPPEDELCNIDVGVLKPTRIKTVPAISLPHYREDLRAKFDELKPFHGKGGQERRWRLQEDLTHAKQIGSLLGFANAPDEYENLYEQVYLGSAGEREVTYCTYLQSMEQLEQEARQEKERNPDYYERIVAKTLPEKRTRTAWFLENKKRIAKGVTQWRLLLRIDSNKPMGLCINDHDPLYVFIRDKDLIKQKFTKLAGEVTQG